MVNSLLASRAKRVCERDVFALKHDCRSAVVGVITKLQEKLPSNYQVVRSFSCLKPILMVEEKESCIKKFDKVLTSLVQCKKIPEKTCDSLKREYIDLLEYTVPRYQSKFLSFNHKDSNQRLDTLFCQTMQTSDAFKDLWEVVKGLLVLSHGQAAVERRFSVNK